MFDRKEAEALDAQDELKGFRERFHIPKNNKSKELGYFCGNSLGLLPKNTRAIVEEELSAWEREGVEGHFRAKRPWYDYHTFFGASLSKVLGCNEKEVVVMNGLTVNLHLMMVSFYRPTKERYRILIEEGAFPSDQYAVRSQTDFHGYKSDDAIQVLKPREGEAHLRPEDILKTIDEEGDKIALIMLGGVNYYTGQLFDLEAITKAGHQKGCVVGFDLAHAAGNASLKLHDWNVDFAAFCTYKYLNAGPGSTAGVFVHERHCVPANPDLPRFAGWWGNDPKTRFEMSDTFVPHEGAGAWQLSNAPVMAMAPLFASLQVVEEAGFENMRKKSKALTAYFRKCTNALEEKFGAHFRVITPSDVSQSAAQLSLQFKSEGRAVHKALTEAGIVVDFREPDVIRAAPVPLYNTFCDVHLFCSTMNKVLG